MRVACARWDDDGRMFHPHWDGAAWHWYADTSHAVEVDAAEVEGLSQFRTQARGYWCQVYWYEEDGTSPDCRPGRTHVTRRLTIRARNHVGRERTPEDLLADLEYWIDAQHDDIIRCCAEVVSCPHDHAAHDAVKALPPPRQDGKASR